MRKLITLFLLISALLGYSFNSHATHYIGSEIFYEAVAPGVFIATYRQYINPSNQIPGTSNMNFNLRSPGCNNGRVIPATFQSSTNLYINGQTSNNCSSNLPDFVVMHTYTATVSITNNQLPCPDWYLSVQECTKEGTANISASQNPCLYVEAYLNVTYANMQTRAPEFLLPTSWYFKVHLPATYSNLVVQEFSNQDSVVYSLKPAMTEHNTPLTYSANTFFSQPIPTSTGVTINSKTGLMTFIPNVYNSNQGSLNNYTIVVEAAVYRKINGVMTKVSASQRNLPVYIVNTPGNANPELVNVTANGQPVQPNAVVPVKSGNTLTFQFNTADLNSGDNLTLVLPDLQFTGFPPNTTASVTTGGRPSGTLTFNTTPVATDQFFYFPVTVMDNACPARGVTTQIYGVKLLANPLGRQEEIAKVNFYAFPNPFTETITFSLDQHTICQQIVIYNLTGQQVDQIEILNRERKDQHIEWQNAYKHAAGTYIARFVSKNKTNQTLKFTKLQ